MGIRHHSRGSDDSLGDRCEPDSHKVEHHDRDRVIFIGPQAQDVLHQQQLPPCHPSCLRFGLSAAVSAGEAREGTAVAWLRRLTIKHLRELKAWQKVHRQVAIE